MAGLGQSAMSMKTKNGAPRKERPKLALDPSQPPTTQGKPRARVFLACAQCRKRKIRCDGAKPACYNCTQRSASGATECSYDVAPRRRGPDRLPGARSRRGVGEPPLKRRRRRSEHEYEHNEHDFDLEFDGEFDGQGDDLARGGLVEVGKGDHIAETYASSADTSSLSPASVTGSNSAHPVSAHTQASVQMPYTALHHRAVPQNELVIDTSASYANVSYARESESAVSVNSTFTHEPVSAVYVPTGSTTYAYDPHLSGVASGSHTQELSGGRYAQETPPFVHHEPSPPSSAVPPTPVSHVQGFPPERYVVPSQGYANANGGYHTGHTTDYTGSVSSRGVAEYPPSQEYTGLSTVTTAEYAGPSVTGYSVHSAARKYSIGSSSHTSFGSPEFAGPSYSANSTVYANGHSQMVDGGGFLLSSALAQAPTYEYQYPSPPSTAQSQSQAHQVIVPQHPYDHLAQIQAQDQTQPQLQVPHQFPVSHYVQSHARQRSASTSSFAGTSYTLPTSFYEETEEAHEGAIVSVGAEPSFVFTRQTWWDSLLALYASAQTPLSLNLGAALPGSDSAQGQLGLSGSGRRAARAMVLEDVKFLFAVAPHWFFFIHVPSFYAALASPEHACPALVLAVCAISALVQSSEVGHGEAGRRRALRLRDEAQSALDAALISSSVNEDLASAAWILAFFEQCCHPAHKHERVRGALHKLDGLMQHLRLSALDAGDPAASTYPRGEVPVVRSGIEEIAPDGTPARPSPPAIPQQPQHQGPALHEHIFAQRFQRSPPSQLPKQSTSAQGHSRSPQQRGCMCDAITFGRVDPGAAQHTPFWVTSPAWQNTWSPTEVRRESARRLAWSAMTLAAGYSSYAAAAGFGVPELSLLEPGNFNLLFPGEALGTGKRSVWALYLRAMLLWLACLRMRARVDGARRPSFSSASSSQSRGGPSSNQAVYESGRAGTMQDSEIAAFAMKAWLESEAIERALNVHTCSVEPSMLYHGREYLFNTRMCISFEFRRFIPHVMTGVGREKSEEWLRDQGRRAKMAAHSLQAVSGSRGHTLAHRPHFVWWFMGQVRRALHLWSLDNTLTIALDVCRDFMMPIEYLTELYPCTEQRIKVEELRLTLTNATDQATRKGYHAVERTS